MSIPSSNGYLSIHIAIYYASKWVEVTAYRNNQQTIIKFLKEHILSRFGVLNAIISNNSFHFCNRAFENLMKMYYITNKISTHYHPQSNRQVELANKKIK